jgi:hypothetical protein
MRTINTVKRLKFLYWKKRRNDLGTMAFYNLMQNERYNSVGEAVFIISERLKDLAHKLPVIGRFLFNDRK